MNNDKERTEAIEETMEYIKRRIKDDEIQLIALEKRLHAKVYTINLKMLAYTCIPSMQISIHQLANDEYCIFDAFFTERKNLKKIYNTAIFTAREFDVIEINPDDGSHKLQFFTIKDGKFFQIAMKNGAYFTQNRNEFLKYGTIRDNIKLVEYKNATLKEIKNDKNN